MNDELKRLLMKEFKNKFLLTKFLPRESMVPISGKVFDENELLNGVEAILDGWWTEGRFSDMFEQKLSHWLGIRHAILVNSGSSANLLAISALTSKKLGNKRMSAGDEVITVAAGFPSTVNPIIQCGFVPVFVDVELGYYNIITEQIKLALSPKTRAIFVAHTLGNPFDITAIAKICKENNLWLIEDNCDALGSKYDGQYTGTFGHLATCSFYPAHHITMGEGGAVFTNDDVLSAVVRSMRDWGRDCHCKTGNDNTCGMRFSWQLGGLPFGYDHKYIYSEIGYNLKVTDIQAAIGLAQLAKLDGFIAKRRENFEVLYEGLKKHENFFILPKWLDKAEPSWFGFLLTVKENAPFTRNEIIHYLQNEQIATRYLFGGNLTKQPYFVDNDIKYRIVGDLKNTDLVMNSTFWVGVYPGINKEMLEYVIRCFDEFLEDYK